MSILDGLLGDKSTMARDIYLAEQLLALSNLLGEQLISVEIRLSNLERRLNAVEKLANEI